MNVAVGCDHGGFTLKREIVRYRLGAGHEVNDVGCPSEESVDYPEFAERVCAAVLGGQSARGILICGTGIGISISANKVKGIRASTAHDSFSVERLVLSNDAQVLCLGERVIGLELARRLAKEFFNYTFDPESHSAPKVAAICAYEED